MRIRTLSKTENENESSLPEDGVRGVRGFKSHLPHHLGSVVVKCERFLEFSDARGCHIIDNRKRIVSRKEREITSRE